MDASFLIDTWRDALVVSAVVGGPFLLAALVVGIFTSLFQAVTQIQENILAFLPKLVAVGFIFALSGNWVLDRITDYTKTAFEATVRISKESGQ